MSFKIGYYCYENDNFSRAGITDFYIVKRIKTVAHSIKYKLVCCNMLYNVFVSLYNLKG